MNWLLGRTQTQTDQTQVIGKKADQIVLVRHPKATPYGGFNLSQGETTAIQAAMAQIFKQFGSKILLGNFNGLYEVSKPISISKELTFLEIIAKQHQSIQTYNSEQQYCTSYLKDAADLLPEVQIQHVLSYLIAGMHSNAPIILSKAPLDPLTGETLCMSKKDGTTIYLEQISYNPTCALFQIICPQSTYTISGSHQISLTVHKTLNSITATQTGKLVVTFSNGLVYDCYPPEMIMSGLMVGEMVMNFNGKAIVKCRQNNLKIEATFNYNPDGMLKTLGSYFSAQCPEESKIYDLFTIQLINNGRILASGYGSWLAGIVIQEQILWKISDQVTKWQLNQSELLPSDSSNRPDLKLMIEVKMQEAQDAKTALEALDKSDQNLRKRKQIY